MVRREGRLYVVRSEDGKKVLGRYATRAAAEKRLRQVEYFKAKGGGK